MFSRRVLPQRILTIQASPVLLSILLACTEPSGPVAQPEPPPRDAGALAQIVSASELSATSGTSTLIHFTDEQWKIATADLVATADLDREHAVLQAAPMPGPEGGMLVGLRNCPRGCVPNLDIDHELWLKCICEPDGEQVPELLPQGSCGLRIVPPPRVGELARFTCVSESCGGECVFASAAGAPSGLGLLGCVCR